jgi:hypothetical protein
MHFSRHTMTAAILPGHIANSNILSASPSTEPKRYPTLFLSARTGSPMRCGADRCAVATRTAYAAQEAARTGQRVTLPSPISYAPLEVMQHLPRKPTVAGKVVLFADAHHADPVTGEGAGKVWPMRFILWEPKSAW